MILQKQVLRLGKQSQIKEDFILRSRLTKTHPWFRSFVDVLLPVTLISSVLVPLERVLRSAFLENVQV